VYHFPSIITHALEFFVCPHFALPEKYYSFRKDSAVKSVFPSSRLVPHWNANGPKRNVKCSYNMPSAFQNLLASKKLPIHAHSPFVKRGPFVKSSEERPSVLLNSLLKNALSRCSASLVQSVESLEVIFLSIIILAKQRMHVQ
jgi:hypothetical protein